MCRLPTRGVLDRLKTIVVLTDTVLASRRVQLYVQLPHRTQTRVVTSHFPARNTGSLRDPHSVLGPTAPPSLQLHCDLRLAGAARTEIDARYDATMPPRAPRHTVAQAYTHWPVQITLTADPAPDRGAAVFEVMIISKVSPAPGGKLF